VLVLAREKSCGILNVLGFYSRLLGMFDQVNQEVPRRERAQRFVSRWLREEVQAVLRRPCSKCVIGPTIPRSTGAGSVRCAILVTG
jgi:hypothetical protein